MVELKESISVLLKKCKNIEFISTKLKVDKKELMSFIMGDSDLLSDFRRSEESKMILQLQNNIEELNKILSYEDDGMIKTRAVKEIKDNTEFYLSILYPSKYKHFKTTTVHKPLTSKNISDMIDEAYNFYNQEVNKGNITLEEASLSLKMLKEKEEAKEYNKISEALEAIRRNKNA